MVNSLGGFREVNCLDLESNLGRCRTFSWRAVARVDGGKLLFRLTLDVRSLSIRGSSSCLSISVSA